MNEGINETPIKTFTKEEALMEIGYIFQNIVQEGSADAEPSMFDQIKRDLEAGKCSPTEAVALAIKISESRQSYH